MLPAFGQAAIPGAVVLIGGRAPAMEALDQIGRQGADVIHGHRPLLLHISYAAFAENSRGKIQGLQVTGNQLFSKRVQSGGGCDETWV